MTRFTNFFCLRQRRVKVKTLEKNFYRNLENQKIVPDCNCLIQKDKK